MEEINYNNALSTSFKFVIDIIPSLTYFAQSVTIPTLTVDSIETKIRNYRAKLPDNHMVMDDLMLQFLVDEDYYNYDKIRLWMLKCVKAQEDDDGSIGELLSDVYVSRLDSNKKEIAKFVFKGAFPSMLGSLNLASNVADADIIVSDITFAYQSYDIVYTNR
ncbi:MAG: hypothetical protein RSC93_00315 [Erysipelotrichaceae bacterium]